MTKEQFNSISRWQRETFKEATTLSKICHLAQEVDELSEAVNSRQPVIEKDENIRREFADCFILLFGAADQYGLSYTDICACIADKMQINRKRKWGAPDKNGVVNHID